ncbi:MAG: hypothetical protein GC185_07455 [Alphaproteobacteria bacterium]|nr:hypothetical protein [Alphaproteobacteria bacterium]
MSKNDKPRDLPISDELAAHLKKAGEKAERFFAEERKIIDRYKDKGAAGKQKMEREIARLADKFGYVVADEKWFAEKAKELGDAIRQGEETLKRLKRDKKGPKTPGR